MYSVGNFMLQPFFQMSKYLAHLLKTVKNKTIFKIETANKSNQYPGPK